MQKYSHQDAETFFIVSKDCYIFSLFKHSVNFRHIILFNRLNIKFWLFL